MENDQNTNFNFTIGANWNQQKEKLKEQYPQLTDSDLQCERGQEQEMLARVETKLDKKSDEIIQMINQMSTDNDTDETVGRAL